MAAGDDKRPIIIKKVKKGGHGGHHGGAWKVAYADFVTAMMAFFLLLWLLNVVTSEQKQGIADYFAPASVSLQSSGSGQPVSGGVNSAPAPFGQTTPKSDHTSDSDSDPDTANNGPDKEDPDSDEMPHQKDHDKDHDKQHDKDHDKDHDSDGQGTAGTMTAGGTSASQSAGTNVSDAAVQAELAKRAAQEEQRFTEAEKQLKDAIARSPELSGLADNVMIDHTREGLRIQVIDKENHPMFKLGSKDMAPHTKELLAMVSQTVSGMPNKLSISGHTDNVGFPGRHSYDNWELSTDRANASRRALVAAGIDDDRIDNVVGRADRDPLKPDDPANPSNRRITIVLLRQDSGAVAPQIH